jgi:hypothetical protein
MTSFGFARFANEMSFEYLASLACAARCRIILSAARQLFFAEPSLRARSLLVSPRRSGHQSCVLDGGAAASRARKIIIAMFDFLMGRPFLRRII